MPDSNVDQYFREITIVKDTWTRVDTEFDTEDEKQLVTIRNIGGTAVTAYKTYEELTSTTIDTYLKDNGIDPLEIGGMVFEISTDTDEKLWVKALGSDGKLSIRIKGTIDPSEDITVVNDKLNETIIDLLNHKNDKSNPHEVTKTQVGLGNLPNKKSDSVTLDDSNSLATSKAVKTVQDDLNSHKNDKSNPHKVTKAQVGLGNVPNFPKANEETMYDYTNDASFMTPYTTYMAMSKWAAMSMNLTAQSIVQGKTGSRPSGWSISDCSPPSLVIEKLGDKVFRVNSGLQVAYADTGRVRLSGVLEDSFSITIPDDDGTDDTLYVYVDLNTDGDITESSYSRYQPCEGSFRTSGTGDFFDTAQSMMFDSNGQSIRRVYVGKVILNNGDISTIISCPIGNEYIYPYTNAVRLKTRTLIQNPFVSLCDTYAEVEYSLTGSTSSWGPTYWNDQIGIMATPLPTNPIDTCVLQTGLMGFLSCGNESGSPFGASFESVTNPDDIRVRIRFVRRNK